MTDPTDEQKHPKAMTDTEFNAAVSAKAWRGPPAAPPDPIKPAPEMTDAEFQKAERNRAWRTPVKGNSNA